MTLTAFERAFLTKLSTMKQGRCSYDLARREDAMTIAGKLLTEGYVKERDLGYSPGLQITDAGREYLDGVAS